MRRWCITCAAIGVLAGCVLRQPFGGVYLERSASTADRGPSWMLRDAGRQNLLYVSSGDDLDVHVFSYPSGKPEGRLTGFKMPEGMCVDRAGDVFISDGPPAKIWEYPHGGVKPIAVFYDVPSSNPEPVDCSIDPVTGNLAVANANTENVAIFPGAATAAPHLYSEDLFSLFACGYDERGDLFIAGWDYDNLSHVGELPKGGSTFLRLGLRGLPHEIPVSVGIKWDGKYVAVDDEERSVIYQVRVRGSIATVVGFTKLTDGDDTGRFWFPDLVMEQSRQQSKDLIGTVAYTGAKFWRYPAGGTSTKAVTVGDALGVAVSLKRL